MKKNLPLRALHTVRVCMEQSETICKYRIYSARNQTEEIDIIDLKNYCSNTISVEFDFLNVYIKLKKTLLRTRWNIESEIWYSI